MSSSTDHAVISFKILLDGSPLKEDYDVYGIEVTKSLNRIASAQIKFVDGSVSKEDFTISDGPDLIPGKEIDIQVGFGTNTTSIFKGLIIAQQIRAKGAGGPFLLVECRDKAVKMTIGANTGTYTDSTDSDVISSIAGKYGLSTDISSTSNSYPQIVQYYATDWDFMVSRAEVNGMVVIACDNKLTVTKPDVEGSGDPTLTFGEKIVSMDLKLDARTQLGGVEAQSWDYKTQEVIQATGANPSVPEQGNLSSEDLAKIVSPSTYPLQTTAPLESADLKTWANSNLLKSHLAKIQGEVKIFGVATIEPNQLIELRGCGTRFNGTAYVSSVRHEVLDGNWWTILGIGLDPNWFAKMVEITEQPASALLPGIRGLQNGTVKQIYEDPLGQFRVEVDVPMFQSDAGTGTVWARWTQPYATSGAGQFFMPEVGDEVVLGFLNEDPRYPVILGSLYSSQRAPAYTPEEKNPIKAIVTKSSLTIEFDDENKVMTLKTPAGNQIILSDEDKGITIQDQNENSIKMNSEGISMQSPSNITINADGEISISGTAGVTVSSEAEVTVSGEATVSVSGLEVSIEGETAFSASAGAEASVSAGGELSLNGAMVMIN